MWMEITCHKFSSLYNLITQFFSFCLLFYLVWYSSPDHLPGSNPQPVRSGRQHHSSAPGLVQQHFYHHQHHHSGGASPLLGGGVTLVRSPHSSLCSTSGVGLSSSHSPLSSSSAGSGGGGHSPHASVIVASGGGGGNGGSQIPALGPVMLTTKQTFLFQPVSEGLSSPSSTSSSSSPSSSSTSMTLHQHLQHQQAVHDHHHFHTQQQQPQLIQNQRQEEQQHQHHHHSLSDMNSDDAASRGSNNDVYMTDSEMGEHHPSEKPHDGFNFKPISPDHP